MGGRGFRGGPGNPAFQFHERQVARFSPHELGVWRGGRWRHEWHDGHFGWWWVLGAGDWYPYDEPVYPYPDFVSDFIYPVAPDPAEVWYYCANPPGYYPYVQGCYAPWQPVPAP
jgi:hypothetical protein